MKLFVQGRRHTYTILNTKHDASKPSVWIHCASLGEYEQGVPVMKAIKKEFPEHQLVVTFFSPSGYEVKKNTQLADMVVYLPLDTKKNVTRFLDKVHPSMAIFVKYEVWPNYLFELKKRQIHTLLISGVFRSDQIFFSTYGSFMRKALDSFNYIFVQDKNSAAHLSEIHMSKVAISGDTRFDRVSQQIAQDNSLSFMDAFKAHSLCLVCGSTWPEDDAVLLPFINSAKDVKVVIAPHTIDTSKIEALEKRLQRPSVRYSELAENSTNISEVQVLIIDTVGLLTKIYSYADVAYVGGAMGTTGLHNILEPATFGVPVIIGQRYSKFPEAVRLRSLAGLYSISNAEECSQILTKLFADAPFKDKTGMIAEHYINSNTGATEIIMEHVRHNLTQ